MSKEEKEIDLMIILIKLILLIKRRFLIIFIVSAIGTSLGFSYGFFEKKKFENKVIGSSDIVPSSVIFQILNTIKSDFQNNNKYFSKEVNLPQDVTSKITKISFDTISFGNKSSIEIKIQSKDSNCCELAKTAILIYLHRNAFINEEYNFTLNQKKLLIGEINQKIKELDSLQRFIRIAANKDKNTISILNTNYDEYITLIEKKQRIEKEIQLTNKIIYVYIDSTTPIAVNILFKMILGFIFSIFISFIIIFILEINLKIREYKILNQIK